MLIFFLIFPFFKDFLMQKKLFILKFAVTENPPKSSRVDESTDNKIASSGIYKALVPSKVSTQNRLNKHVLTYH